MGHDRSEDVRGGFPADAEDDRGGTGAGEIGVGIAEAGKKAGEALREGGKG